MSDYDVKTLFPAEALKIVNSMRNSFLLLENLRNRQRTVGHTQLKGLY